MPTILISGVNRGLGLELFRQYAGAGWRVIGTCRNPGDAASAQQIAASAENGSLHALDVSDAAAVQALAAELAGTAIDVLFLNAGVMSEGSRELGALDAADFLRVLEVNVVAPAICAQAFTEHVAASERRIMVGMGSYLGSVACNTDGGLYSYRASKSGVHAVMRSLSVDLRDRGIIALPLHPGWVKTDMGGENAMIDVEESVSGMRSVIDGLTPTDSGKLLTYSGEELPW